MSNHAEKLEDLSIILLHIYCVMPTVVAKIPSVEICLRFYGGSIYPFEELSKISRKRNGTLRDEDLAQFSLRMCEGCYDENLIGLLDLAMDYAVACVVVAMKYLQNYSRDR
jgi:hypothetical protein